MGEGEWSSSMDGCETVHLVEEERDEGQAVDGHEALPGRQSGG